MADRIEGFTGSFALPDLAATNALAARIAAGLEAGACVALRGDLGAGKTTLARAILRVLGVSENVPSPTFNLIQTYETARGAVYHFDLYRIEEVGELEELGFDEARDQGIVLVEWPERAEKYLPNDALNVALRADGERVAAVSGPASWTKFLADETNNV